MKRHISFALATLLFACTPIENNQIGTEPGGGKDNTVHVTGISIDHSSATIKEGETLTLVANVTPANAENKSVTWSSSSEAVATVDNTGKVTGVSKGNATIKAEANDGSGKYATCEVLVKKKLGPLPTGAVDLGLSVYWSTCNLGASKPEDYGDYYAWGEVETKEDYSWSTYKFGTSSSGPFSKYNTKESYGTVDNKTVLDPEDDAAHVILGGKWRMPTDAEWTELREKCTWTWTTQNGVNGRLVTGPNGNSIFLPAAGRRYNTDLGNAGSIGYYWYSSLKTDDPYDAWYVFFDSSEVLRYCRNRYRGHSIRPVTE